MANVKILKFNMDDPKDVIAYQTLTHATGARKKMIEGILSIYESNIEEPLPERVVYEAIEDEKLRQVLDSVVEEKVRRLERKLSAIAKKGITVTEDIDEESEEEVEGFNANSALKSLVNIISAE